MSKNKRAQYIKTKKNPRFDSNTRPESWDINFLPEVHVIRVISLGKDHSHKKITGPNIFVEHVLSMSSLLKSQMLSAVIGPCVRILHIANSNSMTPIALYFSSAVCEVVLVASHRSSRCSLVPCQNKAQ